MISDRISDDIPPQMKNLNIVIPILMYFLTINIEKMHCFLRNVSVTSDQKHDVNQSQATLGFRRYIAEYTVARF